MLTEASYLNWKEFHSNNNRQEANSINKTNKKKSISINNLIYLFAVLFLHDCNQLKSAKLIDCILRIV